MAYSSTLGWTEHAPRLPEALAGLVAGGHPAEAWSRLPGGGGGDLCPSRGHDEDG